MITNRRFPTIGALTLSKDSDNDRQKLETEMASIKTELDSNKPLGMARRRFLKDRLNQLRSLLRNPVEEVQNVPGQLAVA